MNNALQFINQILPGDFKKVLFCLIFSLTAFIAQTQVSVSLSGTPPTCSNYTNGSVQATATGGWPPYTYTWNNGQTGPVLYGVGAGTYSVTVVDIDNAIAVGTYTLGAPPTLDVKAVSSGNICTNPGDIRATVTGGTPPYSYLWSTGSTTSALTNLAAGFYCVTATDSKGCTDVGCIVVPSRLSAVVTTIDSRCAMLCDGSATAVPSGGTPPYSFIWNTGSTEQVIFPLGPGTYTVTVTDVNGCRTVASGIVSEPPPIKLAINMVQPSCGSGNDGSISVTPSGGVPPFRYMWNTGQTTSSISNVGPGTYIVVVLDANDCAKDSVMVLTRSTNLLVSITKVDVKCKGDRTGSATASVSGSPGPLTFLWSNGATSATISNLAAGTYSVTVTSGACSGTASTTINEPAQSLLCNATVTKQITFFNGNDGEITATANGGTPPYRFLWSNGQTTARATGLAAGTYTVTVTDANNCTTTCSATLINPPPPLGKIGDFVWEDLNKNGIQDASEKGIRGVRVVLSGTTNTGAAVNANTTTSATGMYMFSSLLPGTYKLTFTKPTNFSATVRDAGTNDAVDSDIDPATGMTANIILLQGDTNLTIDAGYYDLCQNITSAGKIGFDEKFCGPGYDPALIVEVAPPVGGVGRLEYMWMVSTVGGPFNNVTYDAIPGATGPTYDPPVIYQTTYYVRCVRREFCDEFLETNVVVKMVGTDAIAKINGPLTVCMNKNYTFTADNSGPNATYTWDFGPNATPATARGQSVSVKWSNFGQRNIKLTVKHKECTAYAIHQVFVSDVPGYCEPRITVNTSPISDNSVLVDWKSAQEGGQLTYTVQWSADGENFDNLYTISNPGTSEAPADFEFIDMFAKRGHNFYRILMENAQTGEISFSEIQKVLLGSISQNVLVYPNPADNNLVVERLESFSESGTIEILNSTGQPVGIFEWQKDDFRQNISLEGLGAGVYFVKVNYNATDREIYRIVKR